MSRHVLEPIDLSEAGAGLSRATLRCSECDHTEAVVAARQRLHVAVAAATKKHHASLSTRATLEPDRVRGSQTPAGWYPDPDLTDTRRYWDGNQWTAHRAPMAESKHDPTPLRSRSLASGYVLAVLFPVLGLVYGVFRIRDGGERVIAVALLVMGILYYGFSRR